MRPDCGSLELQPVELQVARVVVPYERRAHAPPKRRRALLIQSKTEFAGLALTVGTHHLKTYMSGDFDQMLRDFGEL